ncbi:ATP synthase F0 subunit B [Candidatus Woesebacteria bacterium]|nr:MAG: ATP synthase F0 subunit B [Candidatus Woesebacteria bacterium]
MEQLGIDLKVIVFQLINFGLLFIVLKKYLYKPVSNFLDQRIKTLKENEDLHRGLEKNKQSMDEKLNSLNSSNKQKLNGLLKDAKLDIAKMKKNAEKEAKAEADRILSKAQATSIVLKNRSSMDAKREMEKVALETAEMMLGNLLTNKQKEEFTKAAIKRFLQS